jgi:hypothetical protein
MIWNGPNNTGRERIDCILVKITSNRNLLFLINYTNTEMICNAPGNTRREAINCVLAKITTYIYLLFLINYTIRQMIGNVRQNTGIEKIRLHNCSYYRYYGFTGNIFLPSSTTSNDIFIKPLTVSFIRNEIKSWVQRQVYMLIGIVHLPGISEAWGAQSRWGSQGCPTPWWQSASCHCLLRHAVLYHPSPTKLKGSSTS